MTLLINPENHAHFTRATETYEWAWKECMDANNSIHNYLDEKLGSRRLDWAGRYASFLNNWGISHQTDNGWWSKAAVNLQNLEAFIRYEDPKDEDLDWQTKAYDLSVIINGLKKIGRFESKFSTINEIIDGYYN